MEEKVLTLHPEGKNGVRISKAKYDLIREAILGAMHSRGKMTYKDLATAVNKKLEGSFEGSIPWYITTVKLDLEARGVIERVPRTYPIRLRLVTS
jgi:hypothetical protein